MYVYVSVCVCVSVCVRVHAHTCMTHAENRKRQLEAKYVYINVHVYVSICVSACACTHAHVHDRCREEKRQLEANIEAIDVEISKAQTAVRTDPGKRDALKALLHELENLKGVTLKGPEECCWVQGVVKRSSKEE